MVHPVSISTPLASHPSGPSTCTASRTPRPTSRSSSGRPPHPTTRRHQPAPLPGLSLHRIRTALTPADIRSLNQQLQPLVAAGKIDLRYMGIQYLELHAMGFTPASGLPCTDAEFDEVCDWWKSLSPQTRSNLLRNYRITN